MNLLNNFSEVPADEKSLKGRAKEILAAQDAVAAQAFLTFVQVNGYELPMALTQKLRTLAVAVIPGMRETGLKVTGVFTSRPSPIPTAEPEPHHAPYRNPFQQNPLWDATDRRPVNRQTWSAVRSRTRN